MCILFGSAVIVENLWLYGVTFLASLVTLLTGFGLGTILTPAFMIFYDVKVAILLVAIVHFLNNAFKLVLFRKHVDLTIIKRFGLLSVGGALVGANVQSYVHPNDLKICLGVILALLGLAELLSKRLTFALPRKVDFIGGFLSGLLGGLVGNQGAIRSAYLLNYAMSKETFIATATVIALLIDSTRIPIYLTSQIEPFFKMQWEIILVVAVAFIGTFVGKKLLNYFTSQLFKKVVAVCVVAMGILFMLGLV